MRQASSHAPAAVGSDEALRERSVADRAVEGFERHFRFGFAPLLAGPAFDSLCAAAWRWSSVYVSLVRSGNGPVNDPGNDEIPNCPA